MPSNANGILPITGNGSVFISVSMGAKLSAKNGFKERESGIDLEMGEQWGGLQPRLTDQGTGRLLTAIAKASAFINSNFSLTMQSNQNDWVESEW